MAAYHIYKVVLAVGVNKYSYRIKAHTLKRAKMEAWYRLRGLRLRDRQEPPYECVLSCEIAKRGELDRRSRERQERRAMMQQTIGDEHATGN